MLSYAVIPFLVEVRNQEAKNNRVHTADFHYRLRKVMTLTEF